MEEGDGLRMFERKHMSAIMLYLRANGGSATRMSIYNDIANNDHMPDKFAILEDAGLIVQTRDRFTRAVTLTLTDRGRAVADALAKLDSMVRGRRPFGGRRRGCMECVRSKESGPQARMHGIVLGKGFEPLKPYGKGS